MLADETETEILKSIIAQLVYRYRISKFDSEGVPFRTNAYVPENDVITKELFHDREDHNHVLKVISVEFKFQTSI